MIKKKLDSNKDANLATSPKSKLPKSENSQDRVLDDFKKKPEGMSYEQSLKELDLVLRELQNENVSVENLKSFFLKGKACLDHCESLLKKTEQDVLEIDVENIEDLN